MKMVKSLILGSAAGLVAMSGAQAADLPVKAKAVEYVRICSLYGAGFYYIPGTDTCIKLGGYLRVETAFNSSRLQRRVLRTVGGAQNRLSNYYTARSRQDFNIDTRTATEYGVLRTYFDATFTWTSGSLRRCAGAAPLYSGAAPVGNPSDGGIAGGSLGVYHAFIQFAGFTMGKTVSAFDAPWVNYPANNFDGLVGGSGSVTGCEPVHLHRAVRQRRVGHFFGCRTRPAYAQAGVSEPVGRYRGWLDHWRRRRSQRPRRHALSGPDRDHTGRPGLGYVPGVVRGASTTHAGYYGGYRDRPVIRTDKWGWAVQGALQIKNIPTGAGDTINLQAVYTDGATRYNFQSLACVNYAMFGGTGLAGAYQSIGFANASDACASSTGSRA